MSRALNKLSDTQLRKINGTPAQKTAFLNDGGNLSVRHSTSGLLTWYFTYRAGTGRGAPPERIKLGNYPDLSLKSAREKAAQCRAWLAEGKNPRHELNYTVQEALKPVTVGDALTYWLESYAKENRVDYAALKKRLNNHVIQHIGAMPLDKCELRHWLACFDQVAKRTPVTAGFLLQTCKQALKFCRRRRYAISNVLDDMSVADVGKKPDISERVLSTKELGELLQALDKKNILPLLHRVNPPPDCVRMPDGRTEVIGDQRVGFYRNALDRSEGAQQNEGSHIPAYTGSNTAVHHAAGGAEQAHGLIAGGSETGGQRIAVWKISAQEA